MKKHINIIVLLLLACSSIQAQQIMGKVTSSTHKPLQGAYVFTPNQKIHAHTDEKGQFTLNGLKTGDSLLVSHVGYKTKLHILKDLNLNQNIQLEDALLQLNEVVIAHSVQSINILSDIKLQTQPVKSSQELLQVVPGLIIGQHAGGGKAEQLFLRGFDLDHGTDIQIKVDGMPVNMVSHAHGQGYADLHFVIPETLKDIEYGKGPYSAEYGNLATAGYVNMSTRDQLDESTVAMEAGMYNTSRMLAMIDLVSGPKHNAYIASEFMRADGPYDTPQNFHRLNVLAKYTQRLANSDLLKVQASHFSSKWDASGQIPQRAVDLGLISRFGAIDDTEGGQTSRSNLSLHHTHKLAKNSFVHTMAYLSNYTFDLYSNFTFFLNDRINGDQIHQKEERNIFGAESKWVHYVKKGKAEYKWQAGMGLRFDHITDIELSHTAHRKIMLNPIQLGDLYESNSYAFGSLDFTYNKWMIQPALRVDQFNFEYIDKLDTKYSSQSLNAIVPSPKLNIIYNPNHHLQLFLKNGIGFHSNDTRVSIAKKANEILPRVYGSDLGMMYKPYKRLILHTAAWLLLSEQEFVYVGDEGVIEPSGKSQRMGIDLGVRWQLHDYLFLHTDVNYCIAKAIDEPSGADYIPLAPDFTSTGGLAFQHPKGWNAAVHYRYVDDRPANEDNSIVAKGYFLLDANVSYRFRSWTLRLIAENVLDEEWNETQFATESRMQNEAAPVEEIHFIPGTPFSLKAGLSFHF